MWLHPQLWWQCTSLICFYLTDEQIGSCRHKLPELLLWTIFLCIPLAVCLSEIIASKKWALYSVCTLCFGILIVCSYSVTIEFLLACVVITFGSCGYFNLIHCERPKTTDSLAAPFPGRAEHFDDGPDGYYPGEFRSTCCELKNTRRRALWHSITRSTQIGTHLSMQQPAVSTATPWHDMRMLN